ncbi:DMT family transporter [Streptomyces sulphureus]|uniref:DMT family transporter n=1 Tax=Streptomyces sulphureus TaxID=47758 RepID=UPI001FDF3177|nr:DMT family transporter [Streptomyces sulphureus]
MLAATPFLASPAPGDLTWRVLLATAALGAFGTGLAYVWNANVVAAWGAANAAAVTYLAPVVGVALGVVLLGEPVSWNQVAGAVLVMLGIVLTRRRLPGLRSAPVRSNPSGKERRGTGS